MKKEYAVYQLDKNADRYLKFASFKDESLVDPMNYNLVYSGRLADLPFASTRVNEDETCAVLEYIYNIFNLAHPADFTGHSMSVSDVVCIKNGVFQEYYYVDSFGFKLLKNFGEKIVKGIKWDTDGEDIAELPVSIAIDPSVPDEDIADLLSDEFGFCVFGFTVEQRCCEVVGE